MQKLRFESDENGLFGGTFIPRTAGQYRVQITVQGVTPKGENFIRTSEQIIHIFGDNVRFGKSTYTDLIDDTRLQINLADSRIGGWSQSYCLRRSLGEK